MKLSPEGAGWLVFLRWLACAGVFLATFLGSTVLGILQYSPPLYIMGAVMVFYNALFQIGERRRRVGEGDVDRNILLQIVLDLITLTLILYFSDIMLAVSGGIYQDQVLVAVVFNIRSHFL